MAISANAGWRRADSVRAEDDFAWRLDDSIERAQKSLIQLQHPDGYWHAPLEANAQMNSEFIMFMHFMGGVDKELQRKLTRHLFDRQQADGSWSLFAGGEGYPSYTIEAYCALKLARVPATDPRMMAARKWITRRGGVAAAGTLARFYMASIGQVPWSATTALPVEITLLPNWFPVNVYELASWARGTVFALALLQAIKPVAQIDTHQGCGELYAKPMHLTKFSQQGTAENVSLRNFLNFTDRALRIYDRHAIKRLRARAIAFAECWLLDHQDANGSFGGIEPCYLLSTMALKALGHLPEGPMLKNAVAASRELVWDLGDSAVCMPCVSPNWDSALSVKALLASELPKYHPALQRAACWFIDHQIFKRGDWSVKRPRLEPGGWAFEFYNDYYPDVDDSAVIVGVLPEIELADMERKRDSIRTGANWVMGMQSADGGFGAFDADNNAEWLNQLPLADVEAITDPTCPDLTGRVLEMMGRLGYTPEHPTAARAIQWLRREQSPEGSWWGRWGVNHIYGTFSALAGLRAIGIDMREEWIGRAVRWLEQHQNSDGGWGESCLSDRYLKLRGRGESTASQTSWALMGLIAAEEETSGSVTRGVRWLLERQTSSGVWEEDAWTGNGFPNHFYLKYYMYPHYFPLMALGEFRKKMRKRER